MIKKLNQTFEMVNNLFGVAIILPYPKKSTLKFASVQNFVVGAGLIAASVIFTQKWCAVAGALSIASSLVLRHEAR